MVYDVSTSYLLMNIQSTAKFGGSIKQCILHDMNTLNLLVFPLRRTFPSPTKIFVGKYFSEKKRKTSFKVPFSQKIDVQGLNLS